MRGTQTKLASGFVILINSTAVCPGERHSLGDNQRQDLIQIERGADHLVDLEECGELVFGSQAFLEQACVLDTGTNLIAHSGQKFYGRRRKAGLLPQDTHHADGSSARAHRDTREKSGRPCHGQLVQVLMLSSILFYNQLAREKGLTGKSFACSELTVPGHVLFGNTSVCHDLETFRGWVPQSEQTRSSLDCLERSVHCSLERLLQL